MAATGTHTTTSHGLTGALHRARSEPAYGAFLTLWAGFTVLPLVMGLDKFTNVLTDWEGYLAPWLVALLPFSASFAMHVVGVVEVTAAVMVAIRPRLAAYVVALWLAGIIVNLVTYPGYYDVALRDVGLLLAALALARLASQYAPRPQGHGAGPVR
jgi:hypothetical protein